MSYHARRVANLRNGCANARLNHSAMPRPAILTLLAALAVAGSLTPRSAVLAQSTAARAAPAKDYVEADVRFMQGMISHHQQAVDMVAMVPTHGASDRIQLLAKKIDLSQRSEMEMMKHWLEFRNEPVMGEHDHSMMLMPGMLTAEQMKQLEAARGAEFDRLFLTFMIQHHRGALQMVSELFDAPRGGQGPELYRFASDVDADQRTEIARMQQMLDAAPTSRRPAL